MTAQVNFSTLLEDTVAGLRNRAYKFLTGKDPKGTIGREISDQFLRNQLDALKRVRTLTPEEEQQALLRFQKEASNLQLEAQRKGVENLLPSLLTANERKTETADRSFLTRTEGLADSQERLTRVGADTQAAVNASNYRSYGNEIFDRAANLQREMFGRTQDTRDQLGNRLVDVFERSAQADIDYRNQLLQAEKARNSGLPGFLERVVAPAAQIALALKTF